MKLFPREFKSSSLFGPLTLLPLSSPSPLPAKLKWWFGKWASFFMGAKCPGFLERDNLLQDLLWIGPGYSCNTQHPLPRAVPQSLWFLERDPQFSTCPSFHRLSAAPGALPAAQLPPPPCFSLCLKTNLLLSEETVPSCFMPTFIIWQCNFLFLKLWSLTRVQDAWVQEPYLTE